MTTIDPMLAEYINYLASFMDVDPNSYIKRLNSGEITRDDMKLGVISNLRECCWAYDDNSIQIKLLEIVDSAMREEIGPYQAQKLMDEYFENKLVICSELEFHEGTFDYGVGIHRVTGDKYRVVYFEKKTKEPRWGATYEVNNMMCELYFHKFFGRFLYPLLPLSERAVLGFIVDRTIGWGKHTERIKKSHFRFGIPNATHGTGLSEPTINKAIDSLIQKGLISQTRDGHSVTYRISIAGVNNYVKSHRKGLTRRRPTIG